MIAQILIMICLGIMALNHEQEIEKLENRIEILESKIVADSLLVIDNQEK